MESVNIQTPLGIAKLEGDKMVLQHPRCRGRFTSIIIPFYFQEAVTN
jgi:hypothetical protein